MVLMNQGLWRQRPEYPVRVTCTSRNQSQGEPQALLVGNGAHRASACSLHSCLLAAGVVASITVATAKRSRRLFSRREALERQVFKWLRTACHSPASRSSDIGATAGTFARAFAGFSTGVAVASSEQVMGGVTTGPPDTRPVDDELFMSMPVKKKKTKGFQSGVLLDQEGNAIGGGDAPQPTGADEFFGWLINHGCTGLERVQLKLGGGVALRSTSKTCAKGEMLVTIPREAWLTTEEDEDPESVEALAWRFLVEVWAGPESKYAPFVQQLKRTDLSAHPIMWAVDELEWIRVSPEGYEAVLSQRVLAEERVEKLVARTRKEAGMAVVPSSLAANVEALAAEVRWAVCLVEAQGVCLEADETGRSSVALCPLLGDVRNTSRRAAPTYFQASQSQLSLRALQPHKPGDELLQKTANGASGAWLLANIGIVPGAEHMGVPSDAELLEMNVSATTMLQIPPIAISDFPADTHMGAKLRLLAEYAGLELSAPRLPDIPVSKTAFKLPDEAIGTGRLLPTARFLIAEVQTLPGSVHEWMNRFFVRFFKHCQFSGYPAIDRSQQAWSDNDETLMLSYTAELEVTARRLVAQWCQEAIIENSAAVDEISRATGLPIGSSDGVIVVRSGQTVLSHFKAKRKDGSTEKSRKPREARVISVGETTLRVEFIANGRRHEVPNHWVVGAQPVPAAGLLSSGCTPERFARGKLAITLLRTEKAILGKYLTILLQSADSLEELLKSAKEYRGWGDLAGAEKCSATIRSFLARELMELDEETESLQPQTLDQLPQVLDTGEILPPKDINAPIWNMPPVGQVPESPFTPEIIMVDMPTDQKGRPLGASETGHASEYEGR